MNDDHSSGKVLVMVVEDERLLLEAITKKLELEGMDVAGFPTGKEAIEYLNNAKKLPDVIWLDYYLRDMNGLEFMQMVKNNQAFANIPVVVVSNSASPDKVHRMLALGATDYLLKADHRLEEVVKVVQDFVNTGSPKKVN